MPKQPTHPIQIKFLHRPTLRQEAAVLAVMEAMEKVAPGTSFDWYSSGLFNNSNRKELSDDPNKEMSTRKIINPALPGV